MSTISPVIDDLIILTRATCHQFIDLMIDAAIKTVPANARQLIYPLEQNDKGTHVRRVSEQEARFAYVHALSGGIATLLNQKYYYSVETPTRANYTFDKPIADIRCYPKQDDGTRARVDMTLYTAEGHTLQKQCHIEFKENHDPHSVTTDIVKLVTETALEEEAYKPNSIVSHKFQLIENADAKTMQTIFKKCAVAFENVDKNILSCLPLQPSLSILFSFYILDTAYPNGPWGCYKQFQSDPSACSLSDYATRFFYWGEKPLAPVGREKDCHVINHINSLGWTIF